MARKIGATITLDFTTHNPLTGQVQNADALPTSQVFEDDTDIPIMTPVVIQRVGEIGDYRVTFDASPGNGFEVDKSYNVIVEAVVAAITAKARIAAFNLESPPVIRPRFSI